MRILYFGTPAFAVPSLEKLASSGHIIAGVITQPDRPRGRGQRLHASEVKDAAVRLGAPVLQPTRLKDPGLAAQLEDLRADLGVVAAYGRIIPTRLLQIPRLGMINVHASLLPRWRGAAPVHRAIIAGDSVTGVTIMRVVEQLDAGPVLARFPVAIDQNETSDVLEQRLAAVGAELLVETVSALARGPVTEEPQSEADVTYAAKLEKSESAIDWNQDCVAVHNLIRGLQPWPLASSMINGKRILLRTSRPAPDEARQAVPGTVLSADRDAIVVATNPGGVRLLDVQPEGKSPMPVAAFLNGHRVTAGDRFLRSPAGT